LLGLKRHCIEAVSKGGIDIMRNVILLFYDIVIEILNNKEMFNKWI